MRVKSGPVLKMNGPAYSRRLSPARMSDTIIMPIPVRESICCRLRAAVPPDDLPAKSGLYEN